MKKIFAILILTFAFTTGMTAATIVTHTGQALADPNCTGC